jgi:hypothetical protein
MNKFTKDNVRQAIKKEPLALAVIGLIVVVLISAILSGTGDEDSSDAMSSINQNAHEQLINPNVRECILDECLDTEDLTYPVSSLPPDIEDILRQVLDNEYKTLAVHEKVIEQYGARRPFITIIRSEEQSVSVVRSLFDKYGITVPPNTWINKMKSSPTFQAACQDALFAETNSIMLYRDGLLPVVQEYEDINRVLTDLVENAELRYIPAFEKCGSSE